MAAGSSLLFNLEQFSVQTSKLIVMFGENLKTNIFVIILGFIQGTKMSLPVGFQRKDDRKFEEITIPAASSSVTDIPKKLGTRNFYCYWEISSQK